MIDERLPRADEFAEFGGRRSDLPLKHTPSRHMFALSLPKPRQHEDPAW
jgi:hypothetical protein